MGKKKIFCRCTIIFVVLLISGQAVAEYESKFTSRLIKEITRKQDHQQLTAWIYFMDKGRDLKGKMEKVKQNLSHRSYQRRLRNNREPLIVDQLDIPVNRHYVNVIKEKVNRIRHESRWLNAVSVEATSPQLRAIADIPFVKKIDKVMVCRRPFEPKPARSLLPDSSPKKSRPCGLEYGMSFLQVNQIKVTALHDMGYSGKGVLICMLDSGFNNLSHEALDHLDIQATWDFVNNDPEVFDAANETGYGNHGTWTLGTIAGYHSQRLIGPAYGASFILGKTENDEWERHIEEDYWIAGAEWADSLGADIISSSVGYRDGFTDGEESYIWTDFDGETTVVSRGAAVAAQKGILVVNSAGNDSETNPPKNSLVAPSDSEYVVAAGALDESGYRAYFSSTGPTSDGRIKPDVMALGEQVFTADVTGLSEYTYVGGTSFSAPLIAGTAALILEAHPDWSNWQIMDALKQTASKSGSPDFLYGWGTVDANSANLHPQKNVFPPLDFGIQRLEINYIFFIKYTDRLSWKSNPRNAQSVEFYRLYRKSVSDGSDDFELVIQMDNQTFFYENRGLSSDQAYLYKIVAIAESGEESDPNYTRGW